MSKQDIIDIRDIVEDPWKFGFRFVADLLYEMGGRDELEDLARNEPVLIADDYFVKYAQQLAEDIGAIRQNAEWPHSCIDWKQAARELRMDYTAYELDGDTYWGRA